MVSSTHLADGHRLLLCGEVGKVVHTGAISQGRRKPATGQQRLEELKLTKMLHSIYRRHQSGLNVRSSHSVLCEACGESAECIRKSSIFSGTGQGTHRLAIWLDIAAQCDATTPRYGFVALMLLALMASHSHRKEAKADSAASSHPARVGALMR